MLIELTGGEIVLHIDGQNFRPDDLLPDRSIANQWEGQNECDRDLWERFVTSKKRRRRGGARGLQLPKVMVGARVPPHIKEELEQRAAAASISVGKYVARLLAEHVEKDAK